MRQLVINQSIEQTILVEDRPHAVDLMNNSRLPNVKQCFTMNVRAGEGLRLTYGYGGNAGSNYVPPFKGLPRMGTDVEYQIQYGCNPFSFASFVDWLLRTQRQTLDHLKLELHNCENRVRELQRNFTERSQALKRHGTESTNLRIAMQKAEDIVAQLQDAIDADQIEEGRLEALKDALKEAEEERETHEGSYGDCVLSSDKAKDSMEVAKQEMAAIDIRIAEATSKLKKAEAKASKATIQRQKDLQQKNHAINAVQDAKDHHAQVERKHEGQAATVASYIEQAEQISARIPVPEGETAESLDKKLGKLNKDLERGIARYVPS